VDLVIQSVSPSNGPATGGTELTIRGTGFAAGAAITVGGRAATDITVRGADTITAKTPPSTIAGAVDVAVALNGRTSTLAGAFKYDVATNTAPIVKSVIAQGKRLREPPNFADYGETITVTAVVEDAQTPIAQLNYQWVACGGTFSGTGTQVQWTAPIVVGPSSTCTVELVVSDGPRVGTGSVAVRLHDSANEVANLALLFLEEFADSTIPPAVTVRNFSDSCPGKAAELKEVTQNREDYIILSHVYGAAKTTIDFGGMCKRKASDACVITPVEWRSTYKPTGRLEVATGISTISAIYTGSRWWLCDSLADGSSTLGFWFMR
jgi:hypothetical protein